MKTRIFTSNELNVMSFSDVIYIGISPSYISSPISVFLPGVGPCFKRKIVTWILERIVVGIVWGSDRSWACLVEVVFSYDVFTTWPETSWTSGVYCCIKCSCNNRREEGYIFIIFSKFSVLYVL